MGTVGIAFRLWSWAAVLRVLKRVVPLATLVRVMHTRPASSAPDLAMRVEGYLRASGRFPRRPPGNCLERSLGAYRLLCRAGSSPQLLVGVRRTPSQTVEGHVWITVGGRPFGETLSSLVEFLPMVAFDASGRRREPSSPADATGLRSA